MLSVVKMTTDGHSRLLAMTHFDRCSPNVLL